GFDRDDVPKDPVAVDERFSLVHIGSMSATRDLPGLWKALVAIMAEDPLFRARFVLRFVGPVDHSVVASATAAGLGAHIERMGRVSHAEAMRQMQRARVLLLPINDTPNSAGILPGKLYEYLSVGRPILAVGPQDGDVARVLGDTHLLLPREPLQADHARIRATFEREASLAGDHIDPYDRRTLAGAMASLLNAQATARG
ncbi:MAG TPA: glycosyltransferase, partial [Flavobacteriales bacterium]|nr:glycosyltransferase [Flavobacteriales bacterium]